MSSTGRGYERHKTDYYVTPANVVGAFIKRFEEKVFDFNPRWQYLDPCCGGDQNNPATYIEVLKDHLGPETKITGIDIRTDSRSDVQGDFLTMDLKENHPDVIISNPPFYLAEEFIVHSLNKVSEGGLVIMLLRLNFFGSQKRRNFFENNMPKYCFIHHRRISFTGGPTDSIEYAHFVFQKNDKGFQTQNDSCKIYLI